MVRVAHWLLNETHIICSDCKAAWSAEVSTQDVSVDYWPENIMMPP